jgi:hypothetical protein
MIIGSVLSQASLKHSLPLLEKRRRDRCILICSLLYPYASPFQRLLTSSIFSIVSPLFPIFHWWEVYNPTIAGIQGGRPQSLDPAGCLALVLGYTQSRGSLTLLQMVFGVTNLVLCIFFKFGMRLLFKVLKNEEHAQVKVPDVEDTAAYKAVIEANFPDLSGVWCVMD